ncbi:hypothetical protein DSECCO2_435500 [anaerobic digester metagenome]
MNVAFAAAPPRMSPTIWGSVSTVMPEAPPRPTVTDLAVFGRSVRSTIVEPTTLESIRPLFCTITFSGMVWPADTSLEPATEAESTGPPEVIFAPAETGEAIRQISTRPIARGPISLCTSSRICMTIAPRVPV